MNFQTWGTYKNWIIYTFLTTKQIANFCEFLNFVGIKNNYKKYKLIIKKNLEYLYLIF